MNKIMITGRLTKAPEMKNVTVGGQSVKVCNFTVACNEYLSAERTITTYFDCETWRGQAEFVFNNFQKGNWAEVTGNMRCDVNEKNGVTYRNWKIRVQEVGFVGSKPVTADTEPEEASDEDIMGL